MNFIKWLAKKPLKSRASAQSAAAAVQPQQQTQTAGKAIFIELNDNYNYLSSLYEDCSDIVFHHFKIGGITDAFLIFIDEMSDTDMIDQHVLNPLMEGVAESEKGRSIISKSISVCHAKEIATFDQAADEISKGNPVIFVDGDNQAVSLGLAKWPKRNIEEPVAESVVRGPRLGFTEALGVNTSLLRRSIKSPALKMKSLKIGRYTQTEVVVTYIKGVVDPALIDEIISRLQRIDIDGILDSYYVEELIGDNPLTPFPQMLSTERPDVVVGNLLEGRAAVIIDGSPSVLVMPITLFSLIQSPEDYYQTFWAGTFIRWLRYCFFVIALTIPSAYVAILTYHQEMIPTTLLLSVAKSREEIPFPALIEALLMEITFEALREAGLRLPKQVGPAVSIVGALVIGQAAISAGLVSSPMVMVVAFTGIASFTFPRYTLGISIRLLRFPLMFLAGFLGLLGLMLGIITIVIHLCTLRSFGVPYLSSLAPMHKNLVQDVLIRTPLWARSIRPKLTGTVNRRRQAPGLRPKPPQGDGSG
ncbi:spore germination protein [Paenibacillus doosanensis]|uniref:Spore germination protein A1 n=1 Tax=Paenibacillus konkukensis TaxID=2020716 RepID=A0ABY4RXL7_9BACL|nr:MULTISPECIES: spore germination protein [Paenibacillus]MCS7458973.1 spore germination protein [Paenibacillus doosanensis]UQZ86494.1 Spore germination protein A1 [Paenibacillus konkukensis]